MHRTHLILALAALVCLAGVTPVLGHPSHMSVTSQASPDGTVVVGSVFSIDVGFLVLYTDDGGDLGQRLGHARIENGVQTGVEVDIDDDVWSDWDGPRRVWVTIHRDQDDDGEFDPESDPVVREGNTFVGTDFQVERSDEGRSVVVGGSAAPQLVESSTVTVPRAALPTDGYLAIHADEGGEPGPVVGHASLAAGDHRNVSVDLGDYAAEQNGTYRVYATIYADDGDGEFDPETDSQVTVGDEAVMAPMDLRNADDSNGGVVTASNTPATTVETVDDGGDGGLPTPGFGPILAGLAVLTGLAALLVRRR